MVLATNFQKQNSGKVNTYSRIISLDFRQRGKLFIPMSQYPDGGRGSVQ
jgi:hypothetical protein